MTIPKASAFLALMLALPAVAQEEAPPPAEAAAPAAPQPAAALPTIVHAPVAQAQVGQPLTLAATIRSGNGIFQPSVYFRHAGEANWTKIPLLPSGGDVFTATLPGATLSSNIEYYIECYDNDGNGPARAGSPDAPFQVAVALPPPPVTGRPQAAPGAATEVKKPAGNGRKIVGGVLAGVGVIALGAGIASWVEYSESVANQNAASPSARPQYANEITMETIVGAAGTAVGVIGLAVGAYLFFSAPSPAKPASSPLGDEPPGGLSVAPIPGGAVAAWSGRF